MLETQYIKVLVEELNKKYPQPNALWNCAYDNILEKDWLFATPTNCFGKKYTEFPMRVEGDDPDFGLKQCSDLPEAVALQSSIKTPGGHAKRFMPGHSYNFFEEIYKLIISAEKFVDITTLSPFTGYFLSALRNAITYISNKEESKRPIIRIVYSNPLPNIPPLVVSDFLNEITRDVDEKSKMEIYVSILSSSFTSWNHSKIIAVDGTRAIVGGHNMWGPHYLETNPVFDVSMKLNGTSAIHAHCYADNLWDYMINMNEELSKSTFPHNNIVRYIESEKMLHGSYKFNTATNKNEIKTMTYPDKNVFKNIKDSLSNQSVGSIPILAIGRSAETYTSYLFPRPDSYLIPQDEPSDDIFIKLVSLAKKNIRMSLQSFHLSFKVAGYNDKLFIEFGKAIQKGVNINIVLSNPYSIYDTLKLASKQYGGEEPCDINEKLLNIMTNELHMAEITAKNLINTYFNVASIRYSSDKNYPNNAPIPNHAKTFMIDDTVFYIGSQNQYVCDLNEFGYVVEDPEKAQEYINSYFNPLWNESKSTVSKIFSDDVTKEENSEAMLFLLELKKNKRLKKIWNKVLAKQNLYTSKESIEEIREELNKIIFNAGFVTNEKRVAEMLNTAFFKEDRKENLPSSESDRFVKELLTNKQLLDDFLKVVDTDRDSFEKSDEDITKFLKSKGYNCNSSQVIASFNQLRNHILEYWSGNYDTWCTNDGGKSYDETDMQSKDRKDNEKLDDEKVFNGPELIVTGNLDVTIDGIKLVKPNYIDGVLSWDITEGNDTSGRITFSEISRPALIDNFVGNEFFGIIIFKNTNDELRKGKVSYYGRIHNKDEGEKNNPKYNYLWYVLSALATLSIMVASIKCKCRCKSLMERDADEKLRRRKKNDDDQSPSSSKSSSIDDKAEREFELGNITEGNLEDRYRYNADALTHFNRQDSSEMYNEEAGSMAFDMEIFHTINNPVYEDLRLKYSEKVRKMSEGLPWNFCQNELDEAVAHQIKKLVEGGSINLENDKDAVTDAVDMTRVEYMSKAVIIDFVSSNIESEFSELSASEIRAVLSTEVVSPKLKQIISDEESSYLKESVEAALLKEKDHYLIENSNKILQKISDLSSDLDKMQSESDSARDALKKVQEELKYKKEDPDLIEQEKKLNKEVEDLVKKQKEKAEEVDDLKRKSSKNEEDRENSDRAKKDVDKRKVENGRRIFNGGV
ncbi:phospholipase D-like domain-containing protein [Clostridium sp. JS66]|uniref:phospholipase D-like domain-containing protein n=1 Tax=Clostridium sp. JS66 TaxID=3064705 RepID=UPI00298E1730|nr:phospholipase D-like domain-containing protein [Clostridium sp. JS66]WPC43925.1 phospholipase D-like domain-containing protein [Clostridium sp. JS66]